MEHLAGEASALPARDVTIAKGVHAARRFQRVLVSEAESECLPVKAEVGHPSLDEIA